MRKSFKLFYIFFISIISLSLLIPITKSADIKTSVAGSTKSEVTKEETPRNLFIANNKVKVLAKLIKKDLFAFGQTIEIDSNVEHDVFAAGNSVDIKGTIGGNVFAAGQTISLQGKIDGDLFLVGQAVTIEKETELTGNIYVVGGEVIILGKVMGDVNASGGTIEIDGTITGKASITAGTLLTIGKNANIEKLSYQSSVEANIEKGSVIVNQEYTPLKNKTEEKGMGGFRTRRKSIFFPIVSFLGSLALAFLLAFLFRKLTKPVIEESFTNFWSSLGIGFAVFVAAPIGMILIAITMIGCKIAFLFGCMYILFLVFSSSFAGLILGSWIVKLLKKEQEIPISWVSVLIGVCVITLLSWIPFIGWLPKFVLLMVGLGSLCKLMVHKLSSKE